MTGRAASSILPALTASARLNHPRSPPMTPSNRPALRGRPVVKGFFEKRTFSIQYVVADPRTGRAAIVDPVLDFDPKSGSTATHSADEILAYVAREGFTLEWI